MTRARPWDTTATTGYGGSTYGGYGSTAYGTGGYGTSMYGTGSYGGLNSTYGASPYGVTASPYGGYGGYGTYGASPYGSMYNRPGMYGGLGSYGGSYGGGMYGARPMFGAGTVPTAYREPRGRLQGERVLLPVVFLNTRRMVGIFQQGFLCISSTTQSMCLGAHSNSSIVVFLQDAVV